MGRFGAFESFGNGFEAAFAFHSFSSSWNLVYPEDLMYFALADSYFALNFSAFLTKGSLSPSLTSFHIFPRNFATSVIVKSGFSASTWSRVAFTHSMYAERGRLGAFRSLGALALTIFSFRG